MSDTNLAMMPTATSPRPPLKSQHSMSLPSTPNQCPRDRPSHTREPSIKRNTSNPSPRSHPSDSLPAPRRPTGGCKYETGMANAKRRVPYSLGPDKLEAEPEPPKALLSIAEDRRLTNDMKELYHELLPSQESEERRRRLVEKLELILRKQWPGHTIKVNVFGSTGNKLGTTDSDVDICITTDCTVLERVCVLADFLANQGMERVVCVSVAKVPIVKIWDPELRLACDMNVNNPVALENTQMIRTYVEIDERVRPLAMIIKHWTKRRVLNEAALGGTLSSYTWICMIINFLQTRDPPVLPALQQSPFLEPKIMSGLNVAFDKNIACYRGYGSHNSDSLGALLFQFFRYYGHEVDFEISVMSVRTGKVITKFEKNWHLLQDNRLCVEEPFNTSRNLGNTADDTSVRGIHLELRRAFRMVSEANLARCCEQYEPPAHTVDEVRPLPKQNTSANRPILAYPSATLGRLGRGGGRGGRHNGQVHRNSNAGRRASTASTRVHAFSQPLPVGSNVTQAELNLQAQQQQYLLHDRLFQQYQYLQAQEQELRAQLRQQAVLQGRMMPSSSYPQFLLPYGAYSGGQEEFMRARAGSVHQPPLTPPIRPQGFSFATAYPPRTPVYGSTTNPPSPLLHSVAPDSRRSYRRSSFTNGSSGGTLRAQSQPARPVPSPLSFPGSVENHPEYVSDASYHHPRNIVASSGSSQEFVDILTGVRGRIYQSPSTDRRGSEYIGYYLGHSPPLPIYSRSAIGSPFGGSMGSGIENGAVSPQVLAQVPPAAISLPPLSSGFTRPSHRDMELTDSGSSDELPLRDASTRPTTLSRSDSGPVVVNGSLNQQPERRKNIIDLHDSLNTMQFDASTSDDIAVETPTSSDDSSQGIPEPQTGFNEHVSNSDSHITPVEHFMKRKGPKRPPRRVNGHSDVLLTSSESKDSSGSMSVENQVPRANGTVLYQEAAVGSDGEGDEKPLQARAFQLSPVKEVRTPSPTQNRQLLSTEDSAGGASKAKLKSKPKQVKTSITDHPEEHSDPLGIQPNGLTFEARSLRPPNNMGPASGWQTQKRKSRHKKGSKSEADVTKVNSAGGEFLPLDESLRKGG